MKDELFKFHVCDAGEVIRFQFYVDESATVENVRSKIVETLPDKYKHLADFIFVSTTQGAKK